MREVMIFRLVDYYQKQTNKNKNNNNNKKKEPHNQQANKKTQVKSATFWSQISLFLVKGKETERSRFDFQISNYICKALGACMWG